MLWFMGFVALFTLGGVMGVVLAEPPADYQLHNSLFLIAHFHTMIVPGVLFGYFAGLIYWFPKFFGFRLDDRWGVPAFWCWLFGFILAFGPLYILGLMGATRRLDHYSNLAWQPFFIIAAVGAALIALGFVFQLMQLARSLRLRTGLHVGSDPWDGRTLEWAAASPPPQYNFAVLPEVSERDAFWNMKGRKEKRAAQFEDIHMPKNSGAGFFIGSSALLLGFGVVWHMWWLAALALLAILAVFLTRTFSEDTEYVLTAAEVARIEKKLNY